MLQAENLGKSREQAVAALTTCGRDWLVLDLAFSSDGPWRAEEIAAIRQARPGRKMLAYLSIGEAEDYRDYWQPQWSQRHAGGKTAAAPAWLGAENPDWRGNFRVNYWDPEWQAIILKQADKAIARGFDGLYLDLVDAFEGFEYDPLKKDWLDDRLNSATGQTYRQEMIDWVKRLAVHMRAQRADFIIVPQNGAQLLTDPSYRDTISAIGIEDLYTNGDKVQPADHVKYVREFLEPLRQAGKPLFVIEYATVHKACCSALQGASDDGAVLLLTDRLLKTIGKSHYIIMKGIFKHE